MALERIRGADGRFVTGGAGVEWRGLEVLSAYYAERGLKMHEYRIATADALAREMEAYAKDNASWEDRTGDARGGLKAIAVHSTEMSTVYLGYASGIDYAFYLENYVYNGVSYAIIEPTIREFEPLIFRSLA